MELYYLFFSIYVLQYVPLWWWASTVITIVHTVEESAGSIWNELGVPSWLYFLFQFGVLLLGGFAIVSCQYVWLFIAVRLFDFFVTHLLLGAPGRRTAPLLLCDAVVVFYLCVDV